MTALSQDQEHTPRSSMDRLTRRRLKFFLRLNYPVQITSCETGFRGVYPDLPGCQAVAASITELHWTLEKARAGWLTDTIEGGDTPPMPNSHMGPQPEARPYEYPFPWDGRGRR